MKKINAKYCYQKKCFYDAKLHGRPHRGFANKIIYTNDINVLKEKDGELNMYYQGHIDGNELKEAGLDDRKIRSLYKKLEYYKIWYERKIENARKRG